MATPETFRAAALLITKYSVFLYTGCVVAIPFVGKTEAGSIAMSIALSHVLAIGLLAIPPVRRFFFNLRRLRFH